MSRRTPLGFYVAGVGAAMFGVAMAMVAGPMENLGTPAQTTAVRALAGVLAALSGVAAEALWRARPWAYRATLALALAYAAGVTLLCGATDGVKGLALALWILFFSAWAVVPIVMYVRKRSAVLFGTPRRRRPAPQRPPRATHPAAPVAAPHPPMQPHP